MPRNYKTNPHTARWLMAFHRGAGMSYSPQASADAEDRSALNFLNGNGSPARPTGTEMVEVSGWMVKTGPGFTTEKQAKYMISIAHRPSVTDAMRDSLKVRLEQGFARSAASAFIDRYKDIPDEVQSVGRAHVPAGETPERSARIKEPAKVADGRYAVEEDGVLKFFKVKNGRKPGYVFLSIQASDDWHDVRNLTRIRSILATIAEVGEQAAMVRYGHELGVCGRCGRTLTDEASRAAGIGPVCASKD